jgi:predicted PurR-regulated permease PerM
MKQKSINLLIILFVFLVILFFGYNIFRNKELFDNDVNNINQLNNNLKEVTIDKDSGIRPIVNDIKDSLGNNLGSNINDIKGSVGNNLGSNINDIKGSVTTINTKLDYIKNNQDRDISNNLIIELINKVDKIYTNR